MNPDWLKKPLRRLGYGFGKRVLPFLRHQSAILCFHDIGNDHPRHISTRRFRSIIDWLVGTFEVRTVRDFPLGAESPSSPVVAITFDDAYRSQFETARPVLNEHGVPGTFYVPTSRISESFSASDRDYTCMSVNQVKTLHEEGHELGSHSHTHRALTDLPNDEIVTELNESRSILEELTGNTVNSFAYPWGKFTSDIAGMVRDEGFETAVTTENRLPGVTSDQYALPRLTVSNQLTTGELKVKLSALNRIIRWFGE